MSKRSGAFRQSGFKPWARRPRQFISGRNSCMHVRIIFMRINHPALAKSPQYVRTRRLRSGRIP